VAFAWLHVLNLFSCNFVLCLESEKTVMQQELPLTTWNVKMFMCVL